MHLGIVDHLGWAIVVAVDPGGEVIERRRVELVGDGLPAAPIHHHGGAHPLHGEGLDDVRLAALVAEVRTSALYTSALALDSLQRDLRAPIRSMALRTWPERFPQDLATQRKVPWEARVDAIMYRQVLAELADERGWRVHRYDVKSLVLREPPSAVGTPWAKDHRVAYAAARASMG